MELQWWVNRSWRSIPWTLHRLMKGRETWEIMGTNFLLSIQFNVYSMSKFVMELNSPFCGTKVDHKWWDTLYIQDHVRIYDIYIYACLIRFYSVSFHASRDSVDLFKSTANDLSQTTPRFASVGAKTPMGRIWCVDNDLFPWMLERSEVESHFEKMTLRSRIIFCWGGVGMPINSSTFWLCGWFVNVY